MRNLFAFLAFCFLMAQRGFSQAVEEGAPQFQVNNGRESLQSLWDSGIQSDVAFILLAVVAVVWIAFAFGAWQMAAQEERSSPKADMRAGRQSTPPDMVISHRSSGRRQGFFDYALSAANNSLRDASGGRSDRSSSDGREGE